MFDKEATLRSIIYTVTEILKAEKLDEIRELIESAKISIEQTGYDNWNGGIHFYTVYLNINVDKFVHIKDRVQTIEATLLEKFNFATRHVENETISNILIVPNGEQRLDWSKLSGIITKQKFLEDINFLKNTMILVSTGKKQIQEVNDIYKEKYILIHKIIDKLNLTNPNPFRDLWDWYTKWSSDFPHYRERRVFVNQLYNDLLQVIEEAKQPNSLDLVIDLTDWERIERSINEIKLRLDEAKTEEQFQVIGLLCRETIITLSQTVYDPDKHPILDSKEISKTDAKRMLEAYITIELSGSSNETLRRYAKATLDLSNELTHRRTATKKEASLCSIACISIVNLIGTLEGKEL